MEIRHPDDRDQTVKSRNPIRALAGQTMVYGLGTVVPRTLNYLLLTFFYTRVFQQGEYGVVTELYAYAAFLLVLLTYGMETALFRFAESEEDGGKVYGTALGSLVITSGIFIAAVLVFSRPLAGVIRYSSNVEYIVYFALIIGIDAFTSIPFAWLRQQNRAFRFALLKIINVTVNILFNLFFLYLCPRIMEGDPDSFIRWIYNPEIGVGYAFISNLIATSVTLILLLPELRGAGISIDWPLLRRMLNYAFPLLVVGLAGMVNEVSDKILLKYLWPDPETALQQVGVYGASYRLAVLMTIFTQMFRYAAEPFFFSHARKEEAGRIYSDVLKYFVICGLVIFLVVMLYMDLVRLFLGKEFREGLHVVPIILLANLLLGVVYNLSIWYKLKNLTRFGAVIGIAGALVTLVLNVILIPAIGYLGCAWAHLACYVVMVLISYFWGQKYMPVRYEIRTLTAYFMLALSLYFASVFFAITHFWTRTAVHTLLLAAFCLVVYFAEQPKVKKSFPR